jgi:hypothetical protein
MIIVSIAAGDIELPVLQLPLWRYNEYEARLDARDQTKAAITM